MPYLDKPSWLPALILGQNYTHLKKSSFHLELLCFLPPTAPASPDIVEGRQPDGTIIRMYIRGDERINWMETGKGYTIARDAQGYWRYVQRYEGKKPVLSEIPADKAPPEGLGKNIRPTPTK